MLGVLSAWKWLQKRDSISRKKNFRRNAFEKNERYSQRVKTIRSIGFSGRLYTSSRSPAILPANDNITAHGLTPPPRSSQGVPGP